MNNHELKPPQVISVAPSQIPTGHGMRITGQAGRSQEGVLGFECVEFPEVVHQLHDEVITLSIHHLLCIVRHI